MPKTTLTSLTKLLNMNIPSFSAYPSGSFYRSESVEFSGKSEGE
jgi:hypothetical protein